VREGVSTHGLSNSCTSFTLCRRHHPTRGERSEGVDWVPAGGLNGRESALRLLGRSGSNSKGPSRVSAGAVMVSAGAVSDSCPPTSHAGSQRGVSARVRILTSPRGEQRSREEEIESSPRFKHDTSGASTSLQAASHQAQVHPLSLLPHSTPHLSGSTRWRGRTRSSSKPTSAVW
jgi:hypothetical protein